MPLLIVSGLPSPGKKAFFLSLLDLVGKSAQVLVIAQNAVGVSVREEVSRIKSLVSNRLSTDTLVAVYAPLHIKSLRYELSSIACNLKMTMVHVFYRGEHLPGGEVQRSDLPRETDEMALVAPKGPSESFAIVQKVFETPRASDKWDAPVFTAMSPDAFGVAAEKVSLVLSTAQKRRTSCTKLIPRTIDQGYLTKTKEAIDAIISEKKKQEFISLKRIRQVEADFLHAVKVNPPPLESIPRVFSEFLDEFLKVRFDIVE
ncbi:protein KTI12 [Nematocida displodere]|uniref:Protein KTI12 n=1 Tax=Nematocida displodere TaxID=1805483 RepID=A0A177EJ95_9MICR|nr:protein KTI12 [Nematocida displodere]